MQFPASNTSLPRQAGGFKLHKELGRGGMGVVYLAEELDAGRMVALKVLSADVSVSTEAFERFRREARIAASISDAGCVFVYGAHQVEGQPAIAMELVGGETLQDRINQGEPIPIRTAVRWTLEVIDGLIAAHEVGVLHRDVKPSNCFLTPDGRVKVGDFGLSRALERDVQLTQSGQFIGSPLYASPEQIRGRTLDARSDLYSCAATLYALLTGKAPYGGSNVGEVLARILSEPPPRPRAERPDIPTQLEKIVLKGMEREPEKRFRDLAALREALVPFAEDASQPAGWWRRIGAALVDVAVIGAISQPLVTSGWVGSEFDLGRPWAQPFSYWVVALSPAWLYPILLEGTIGATLGKWALGLRVVSTATGHPAFGRAALRTLVYGIPSILHTIHLTSIDSPDAQVDVLLSTAALYVVVAALFLTARRRNGWRALHEFASGTRLIQIPYRFLRKRSRRKPLPHRHEASPEFQQRVGDYELLGIAATTNACRILEAKDTALARNVWIAWREPEARTASEERRNLLRPTRLRWIDSVRCDGRTLDVFESPGGMRLETLLEQQGRMSWSTSRRWLKQLAAELVARERAGETGASLCQLWVDRRWDLRLIDEPSHGRELLSAPALLAAATATILRTSTDADARLPSDVPISSEPLIRRLLAGTGALTEALAALEAESTKAAAVDREVRLRQVAVGVLLPLVLTGLVSYLLWRAVKISPGLDEAKHLAHEILGQSTQRTPGTQTYAPAPFAPLVGESREARLVLIADRTRDPFAKMTLSSLMQNWPPEVVAQFDDAYGKYTQPQPDAVSRAEERARADRAAGIGTDWKPRPELARIPRVVITVILTGVVVLWGISASLMALVLRSGVTFSVFGLALRARNGERASRLLCLARSLISWVPIAALTGGAAWAASHGSSWALVLAPLAVLLTLAFGVSAVFYPTQTLADRLLGTRIVPH